MNLIGFDLETTGLDVCYDRPVQIGLVSGNLGGPYRIVMNTLVNPGIPISEGAAQITGITDVHVKHAPDYLLALWQANLLASAMQPQLLVTFNGSIYDLPLVAHCTGQEFLPGVAQLDLLDVALRYYPTAENHKLGTLYQAFTGHPLEDAHDATVDILGMLELLERMLSWLGMPLEALVEDMKTPRPWSVMPFSKQHKGKPLSEVPSGFAKWLLNQNAGKPMRPDMKASIEVILGTG